MSAHGHVDLGHTVAGWTGTALALVGSAAAGAALCASWTPGVWIGLGVVLGAGVTTWLLHLAGWGKPSGPRPEVQWDWRGGGTPPHAGHADCLGCRLSGPRRGAAAAPGPGSAAPLPAAEGGA